MNSEFQREQNRVKSVTGIIKERISGLEEETAKLRNEVVHIRKHYQGEYRYV